MALFDTSAFSGTGSLLYDRLLAVRIGTTVTSRPEGLKAYVQKRNQQLSGSARKRYCSPFYVTSPSHSQRPVGVPDCARAKQLSSPQHDISRRDITTVTSARKSP